jgi:hypothetical protein
MIAFSICAAVMLAAVLASLAVPGRRQRQARSPELADSASAQNSREAV